MICECCLGRGCVFCYYDAPSFAERVWLRASWLMWVLRMVVRRWWQ